MFSNRATSRRRFLVSAAAIGSLAGCLGKQDNRPGVIDAADMTVASNSSAEVSVSKVTNDNDSGLKIDTEDSIADDWVKAKIPTTIPNPLDSTVQIHADVEQLDDDAEIEIEFREQDATYRRIFIGNEYKNKENGVLATETGTGFSLRKPFRELPSVDQNQDIEIGNVDQIRIVVRDGDFAGTIWSLVFVFENRSIGLL